MKDGEVDYSRLEEYAMHALSYVGSVKCGEEHVAGLCFDIAEHMCEEAQSRRNRISQESCGVDPRITKLQKALRRAGLPQGYDMNAAVDDAIQILTPEPHDPAKWKPSFFRGRKFTITLAEIESLPHEGLAQLAHERWEKAEPEQIALYTVDTTPHLKIPVPTGTDRSST